MRLFAFLVLVPLVAGCAGGNTPASPTADATPLPTSATEAPGGPSQVYQGTIAFSVQTTGEQALDVPATARSMTLEVEFRSDAPVSSTAELRIAIEDATGDTVLDCEMGAVVSGSPGGCGPKTTGIGEKSAPFKLVWSGNGNVEADVLVTAS